LLTASADPLENKLIQYLVQLDLHNLKVTIVKELTDQLNPHIVSLVKALTSAILLDFRHGLLVKADGEQLSVTTTAQALSSQNREILDM
jgi:hypothetical protein